MYGHWIKECDVTNFSSWKLVQDLQFKSDLDLHVNFRSSVICGHYIRHTRHSYFQAYFEYNYDVCFKKFHT
jgi:hypothetical protein